MVVTIPARLDDGGCHAADFDWDLARRSKELPVKSSAAL
jgi:hypothetical protein